MQRLAGKTAMITGGGSGIGRSIAMRFAQEGARCYLFEIDAGSAEAVAQEIAAAGGVAHAIPVDVSHQQQVEQAVAALRDKIERLDILVNNAGIAHIGKLHETSEADLDRLYQVNIKGVYNCSHAVINWMREFQGGCILNIASIASKIAVAERFAYGMTKGAVLTMTYSIAADYVDDGIRCNCVCPARVHTPFVDAYLKQNYPGKEQQVYEQLSAYQPIGRMGKPDEIAALAAFLCSDEASFITGAAYDIDGGVMSSR